MLLATMTTEAADVDRPLTGDALALTDVELVLLATTPGAVPVEPLLVEPPAEDDVLPGDVPLILLVASFTS